MLGLSLIVAFAFQGSRGLFETTEGRYAEVAREMLDSGNYLEPTIGYRAHWTKPPLAYWTIAGGMRLLGRNEWGVRFSNAVAFVLTTWIVFHIGALLWNKRAGVMAGLVYATSANTIFGMNSISTDTLLTLWEITAVFCYLKAGRVTTAQNRNGWRLLMWVFFGLGFLTKGPPALLPLPAIWIWHRLSRQKWRLFNVQGVLLFLVVALWWYLLVCFRHPELLTYFLGTEVIARVASDSFHRNSEWYKPLAIYLPFLTVGAGVWSIYLLKVVIAKKLFRIKTIWNYLLQGTYAAFLLLWILIPLLIFFISKSRLPLYVLPLVAPVSLIIGYGLSDGYRLKKITIIAGISAVFLIGLKGASVYYSDKNDMKALYAACMNLGGANAKIASYKEHNLNGLQFYLNGNLTRLSDRKKPWSDDLAENFIANELGKDTTVRHLFVMRPAHAEKLKGMLDRQGVTFEAHENRFWQIYVTPKKG